MLRELGRTQIGLPQLRSVMADVSGFRLLPLDLEQLDRFASLGGIRDPFDRFILSAARAVGARLISRDAALAESGLVEVIW